MNQQPRRKEMLYMPYMCDHLYALAAAMQAHGMAAEVLPPPDPDSLAIGLETCRGRECIPCLYTIGDIIRQIRSPGFDAANTVFLMPTGQGPCRFGQYLPFQQQKIRELGFPDIQFAAPAGENSYQGFGENPAALRMLIWEGIVAVDLLQKLLHEYRPYELNEGESDEIYQACLLLIVDAVRSGGKRALSEALESTARRFESLVVDRSERRPLIGIVGEIYMRVNPYVNQDVVHQVEAAGGEVYLATVSEWLYFTNWCFQTLTWELGAYWDSIKMYLTDFQQTRIERRLSEPVAHLLRAANETPVKEVLGSVQTIIDPMLGLEAVFTLGKGMDMAAHDVSGILNVMPFNCMSGIISCALAPTARAAANHVPWLDVVYDGQERTNLNTRLEAFMYQARRHGG